MPNHVHMILRVTRNGADGRFIATTNISVVIQQLKRQVSKAVGFSVWQKSFHDHVIRGEQDYLQIAEYIENNPARWLEGRYHVD